MTSVPAESAGPRRIVIVNQKGGSGKTTTAVNLAACLGELGRRVLLIDLDRQASASDWLLDARRRAAESASDGLRSEIRPSTAANVDLIPAWSSFGAERKRAGKKHGADPLRQALDRLPAQWDYILIDCPPTMDHVVLAALGSFREIVVPVEAHVMAMAGLASLVDTVHDVHDHVNPGLRMTAIVPCRVNRTSHSREVVGRLRQRFGPLVVDSIIRENVRLAEAPSFHKPIIDYAPASPGARDYRALAVEIAARANRATMTG